MWGAGDGLHEAVGSGDLAVVRTLIQGGADTETKDVLGNTPLMAVATKGNLDLARYLVENGASIAAKNKSGSTALALAAQRCHEDIVQYLHDKGADIDAKDQSGYSTLVFAATEGNDGMARFLVDNGADKEAKDILGNTPLMLAATKGNLDLARYLVENGASIAAKNKSGSTALALAAQRGHEDVVQYLQSAGKSNIQNNSAVISVPQRDQIDAPRSWQINSARPISERSQGYRFADNVAGGWEAFRHANQQEIYDTTSSRYNPHEESKRSSTGLKQLSSNSNTEYRELEQVSSRYQPEEESLTEHWLLSDEDVKPAPKAFTGGSLGTLVYMAKYGSAEVVMKRVEITSDDDKRRFQREVRVWKEFAHPNIVKFYGANNRQGLYYMVSEFAENGNLIEYLKRGNQTNVWRKLKEVADGLKYLHEKKKIIHGDLKGNNIVVNGKGTAMLVDFGMSFYASGSCSVEAKKSYLGAMHWRAPEYAIVGTHNPSFDSDVYSLGMCIVQAVKVADVPWGEENLSSDYIRQLLCEGERVIPYKPEELTEDQWQLVKSMITFDRASRPKLNDVIKQLEKFAEDEEEQCEWGG